MRAGALRNKIRFDSRVETQSADGQITISWSPFKTVRAAIEPLKGAEFIAAQGVNERLTVRIWIRYLSGLDTDMRIVDTVTGETYDVLSIINNERRNRCIEILAENLNDATV